MAIVPNKDEAVTKDRLKLAKRQKSPHSKMCTMASMHADRCLKLQTQAGQVSDVDADGATVATESRYKGRSIHLCSTRQDEKTWVCEYTIVEFRPTGSFCESGYPTGLFTTSNEAEAVALEVAQGVIDARDPVEVLINGSLLGVFTQEPTLTPTRTLA